MLSEHGEVGSLVRGGILAAAMMCALPGQGARRENHLAGETSPYLRQHRFNPVDWYPWGKEALARAKQLDRPIFLSIGYSACHWCHVMAEESFSDPEIAKLLNENFVCIKVDREERPDIDEIYMGAVQVMGVSGGWPLSVWLTPEGEPFYGGTYFPPVDRPGGRPAFRRVCQGMIDAWRERREEVRKGAGEIGAHLRRAFEAEVQPGEPTAELLAGVLPAARARFDPVYKGFAAPPGYAPKFPGATELQALLRLDDADAHELVFATLHAMRRGGMHDQLGGGFHRYSTDRRWLVPHFEKMLYDNALLASCYAEAFVRSGDERFAQVVRTTLDYLLREMQGGHGGFFASQDAQSEGVEGKFFVWRKGEIDELLGPASARTCEVFGVSDAGNFGGANVLSLAKEAPEDDAFAAARERLFRARAERVPPATDRKVLADWNGLTLVALCDGYRAIGEPRWLAAAQRAAGFLCRELVVDGRVWHSYLGGSRRVPGLLADHAALARGLLAVFECDGDPRWLVTAREILAATVEHFSGEHGALLATADDHERLLARVRRASEGPVPSGPALAAQALLRAGLLLGDEALYERGVAVLRAEHDLMRDHPGACPSLLLALHFHVAEPEEIVVAGPPDDARTRALLQAAWSRLARPAVVAPLRARHRDELAELSPVFRGKTPLDSVPAAYVCRRGACQAPVTDPARLR